jgi:hypothetical protein
MDFQDAPVNDNVDDKRPTTYMTDANVADAKEKLKKTGKNALLSNKDVKTYEAYIVNIGKGKDPLVVRWKEDDDLEEMALTICVSERLDVDINLKQILAQLKRKMAKGEALEQANQVINKNALMSPGAFKAQKYQNKGIKQKKEVKTLKTLEKFMHASRIDETASSFRLNENRLRIMYLISRLTDDGADGNLHIVLNSKQQSINQLCALNYRRKNWLHEMTLIVFIHESICAHIFDYEVLPVPTTAPYVGYINTALEAKNDIELLRQAGLIEIVTVQNNSSVSKTMSTSLSGPSLITNDLDSYQINGGIVRLLRLTRLGEKEITVLDDGAKSEVESVLFPSLGIKSLFTKVDDETNNFKLSEKEYENDLSSIQRVKGAKGTSKMFRVIWHKPRAEFLLCSTDSTGKIILPPSTITNTKRSTITDITHVSYVCSPWLPPSLQIRDTNGIGKKPSKSNREIGRKAADIIGVHLGPKLGRQERTAQDALNEVLLISGVNGPRILLGDWIPGVRDNQIWELDHVLSGETNLSIARSGAGPAGANNYAKRVAAHKTSKTPSVYLYSSGTYVLTCEDAYLNLQPDGGTKTSNDKYTVKQADAITSTMPKMRKDKSIRVVELLGVDYKHSKLAVTLEPGLSTNMRSSTVNNCCELGEFALNISGDGSAIYGIELESIDQHLTFVKSITDVKKVSGRGVNALNLCRSLSQLQRRSTEISNSLFLRGGRSPVYSTQSGGTAQDLASGISDLMKVIYGESNGMPYTECIPKYAAIIAGQFQPFMKPPEYLDGSDYELRLSSLIGRCVEAHELNPGESIIVGCNGLILTGKRCDRYEDLISRFVRSKAKERALNFVSNRVSQLEEYLFKTVKYGSTDNETRFSKKFGMYNQTLVNVKRVIALLKGSILYNFTDNETELLAITEIDKRMESPSKYDRYVKKNSAQQEAPNSPSMHDTGHLKLHNILDIDAVKESNKRRISDLESKILWLIESFENEEKKVHAREIENMNKKFNQQNVSKKEIAGPIEKKSKLQCTIV